MNVLLLIIGVIVGMIIGFSITSFVATTFGVSYRMKPWLGLITVLLMIIGGIVGANIT